MKQYRSVMVLVLGCALFIPCAANEAVQSAAKAAAGDVTGEKLGKLYKTRNQAESAEQKEMIVKACVAGSYAIGDAKNAVKIKKDLDDRGFVSSFMTECDKCRGTGKVSRKCYKCKGTGKCQNWECNENWEYNEGMVTSPGFDGQSTTRKCSTCGGTGVCKNCRGSGEVSSACAKCRGSKMAVEKDKAMGICKALLTALFKTGKVDEKCTAGMVKTITLPGGATMELVYCPPGEFIMGSPADEESRQYNEGQHRVRLTRGFWIGKYPVTQQQYESVIGINPSQSKNNENPVDSVSWSDAQSFCERAKNNLRLPTEAEWEYACRAGSSNAYGGTGHADEVGWHVGNSKKQTHPVGSKKPNAWGVYDMHGNVWEWCSDWYSSYSSETAIDPIGPKYGDRRVDRGGAWSVEAYKSRSAFRVGFDPRICGDSQGFRVACTDGSLTSESNSKAMMTAHLGKRKTGNEANGGVNCQPTNKKPCSVSLGAYKLELGDFCNLASPAYRKDKGIDALKVSMYFDKQRNGNVYRYITKEEYDDDSKTFGTVRLSMATEQSRTIVETSDAWLFFTETEGLAEVTKYIHGLPKLVASHACKNEIVAMSSNVAGYGLGQEALEKALATAYTKVCLCGKGEFGIQWKRTDDTYISWECCVVTVDGTLIIMSSLTASDVLIRDDVYGNKE